ncbi:MAG: hypothetical protein KDJ22_02935 [Candidatus Competibacteraceae bacterium]|nr:hypothetical protein [Candidatus Competibacteraceae bacterium]MCP5125554.1 hypothetical protein [Gammaproteobacteria bacterium]HRX71592.1 hypothetical protein [Candidatus Competibacteraceae bacterium]
MATHLDALVASDYVICATLRKVPDVFNAELLWERVRGGQEGVCLMEALKRHPRTPRARQRKETRYSQIVIRIPERDYIRDDRLEDSFGRRTLLRELQRLHEQELGRYLAEETAIRYRVEPDTSLRSGEVQFLFGRAIHIPVYGESPLFRIDTATDRQSEWRQLGLIYPGQRLTLLNGDRRASSMVVTAWPFISGESVLLMLRPGPPIAVDVVAEPPACLTVTGDGSGRFLARDRRGRGLRLWVAALSGVEESPVKQEPVVQQTLSLPQLDDEPVDAPEQEPSESAVESVEYVNSPDVDVHFPPLPKGGTERLPPDEDYPRIDPWGRREPVFGIPVEFEEPIVASSSVNTPAPLIAEDTGREDEPKNPLEPPAPHPTLPLPAPAVDQQTWIPRRPAASLQVSGVALQRLSTYASAGISDWRLSFNRAGSLAPDHHPEAVAWLRIDSADQVFGEVAGLSTPLDLPSVWRPFPELELELYGVPGPMAAHYLGWLRLPTPLTLPVPRERAVSFGRGSEADIAPRLLADPRSLRWDGNPAKTVGISAEYLGLSRRHLRLQVRRDGWWAQLESQNMPVYRLTPSGDLLDVLAPGVNTATEAKPGELLVAGGYVLTLGAVS